jgi:hypothetical protein
VENFSDDPARLEVPEYIAEEISRALRSLRRAAKMLDDSQSGRLHRRKYTRSA